MPPSNDSEKQTTPEAEKRGDNIEFKCNSCNQDAKTEEELRNHMEEHTSLVEFKCGNCNKVFPRAADLQTHTEAMHTVPEPIEIVDSIVQLRCEYCTFEGITEQDMKNHGKDKCCFKCIKCEIIFSTEGDLRQHEQSVHKEVQVILEKHTPTPIQCTKCKYICTLNIQLKKHIQQKHENEQIQIMKFNCNFCDYGSNLLTKMFEHRLDDHKEDTSDFISKHTVVKDMLINLIAEQNIEILQEFEQLKRGLKDSFEQLSEDVKILVDDATESKLKNIEDKLGIIGKNMENQTLVTKNIRDVLCQPKTCSSSFPSPPTDIAAQPPSPYIDAVPPPHIDAGATQPSPSCDATRSPTPGIAAQPPPSPQRPVTTTKNRKSVFLSRPKILYVGDSIATNVNFRRLEEEFSSRIKTAKAYSCIYDKTSRWPQENIHTATEDALNFTNKDDKFTHLVLGAPSVDITNIDTSKLTPLDNIEVYKQKVLIACQNLLTVAENSIQNHPYLKKVVILEHAPRFDMTEVDPTRLKPRLARYANYNLAQMCNNSVFKDKLSIGKHSLDSDISMHTTRYRDNKTGRYDGIHMFGRQGSIAFTDSVSNILECVLKLQFSHSHCPQAQHMKTQSNLSQRNTKYNVSVYNKFETLGN